MVISISVANYTQGKVYSEPFEISWACLNPVIDSVLLGVTEPMNGFAPQYTVTTDSNRYILKSENAETVKNGIKWTGDVTGELAVSGSKFNNDNDYTVSIKLVAQDGYTFANNVTATINANNANVSVESDTEIRISYTFPKPEKQKWYVQFSNVSAGASGTMETVWVEEGEYTLPEHTYTPNTGYVFEGWLVAGLLKQPGDVITVTENTYLEAKWKNTIDYDAPHGFTKQPIDVEDVLGTGTQIKYSVNNFTVDPSIDHDNVFAEIYDSETGEWLTAITDVSGGNGIQNSYGEYYIMFISNVSGEFTFRLRAHKNGATVAISEPFTVKWNPKTFTSVPFGDSVDAGDTVTVTADVNFYTTKYEVEYFDEATQTWKLYQTLAGTEWDYTFSCEFTSNEGKTLKFRINAYTEGNVYDEENGVWLDELVCTSEEFTITWKPHEHTYSSNPNKKDENNHWKECIDPKCTDTENKGKIEVAPHKAIGGNCQTEGTCACGEKLLGDHVMSGYIQENEQHYHKCLVPGCTYSEEKVDCAGGTATCTAKAKCSVCNKEYGELAEHKYSEATCTAKAKCSVCGDETGELAEHKYSEASCTAKAKCSVCGDETGELAAHKDENTDGKCDACEYQMSTEEPTAEPEQPTAEPETPTAEPETPTTEPETPTAEPETPTAEPEQPTAEPETPTAEPEQPTAEPEQPTTAPEQPTEEPGDEPTDEPQGLSGGAIAAIVIGSVVTAGIGGFAIFWFAVKKKTFADLATAIKGIWSKLLALFKKK